MLGLLLLLLLMTQMVNVDGQLVMAQLMIQMRARRGWRLMGRMHVVIVTRLRILGMGGRKVVVVMGSSTVRQQTVHRSNTYGNTHCALLRDAIS